MSYGVGRRCSSNLTPSWEPPYALSGALKKKKPKKKKRKKERRIQTTPLVNLMGLGQRGATNSCQFRLSFLVSDNFLSILGQGRWATHQLVDANKLVIQLQAQFVAAIGPFLCMEVSPLQILLPVPSPWISAPILQPELFFLQLLEHPNWCCTNDCSSLFQHPFDWIKSISSKILLARIIF